MDIFEVVFHACTASIMILCKSRLRFIGKLQCQREEANEQNYYAVVIVKRTAGVLRIKVVGHRQSAVCIIYLVSKVAMPNVQ